MGRSRDRQRGCKIFVADLRTLPACRGGESPEKALLVRCVWLDLSRRHRRRAGVPATSTVGAPERVIVGEHPGLRRKTRRKHAHNDS